MDGLTIIVEKTLFLKISADTATATATETTTNTASTTATASTSATATAFNNLYSRQISVNF